MPSPNTRASTLGRFLGAIRGFLPGGTRRRRGSSVGRNESVRAGRPRGEEPSGPNRNTRRNNSGPVATATLRNSGRPPRHPGRPFAETLRARNSAKSASRAPNSPGRANRIQAAINNYKARHGQQNTPRRSYWQGWNMNLTKLTPAQLQELQNSL
jgi:hypothetical protein